MSQDSVYKYLKKHGGWMSTKELSIKLHLVNGVIIHNLNQLHKYHEVNKKIIKKEYHYVWVWKAI